MRSRYLAKQRRSSSALVITLLVVVLLTIVVVSFMQTMSLSRTTTKSYADIRRATLAAQAGLDTAIAQITLATGTNMAFVTGLTNFPATNFPLTVIGAADLTNMDQMMPLVSGPIASLTNFGSPGFASSFSTYASVRANGNPLQTVDVNTPYQFIQNTSDTNLYRAAWVTMTNTVGFKTSYTRFAYVVLDDAARVNPALMNGMGTGFSNTTNWYTGPQDIALTNASAQMLTSAQLAQVTSASNSFIVSDATLGETFDSRTNYEAVKYLFTSQTNASFDVIPAWLPNGGMPKYNINDLATNTAYGLTPMLRAAHLASIVTNNFPNFYKRDPALTAAGNKALYVNRLTANMVDYISPDGTLPTTDYSTNTTGISPQGHGVYPVLLDEMIYSTAGGASTPAHTSSTIVSQFWLSCWNPYTTPVTIKSAALHISARPGYTLGNGSVVSTPDYTNSVSVISGSLGSGPPPIVVAPNEFVVLGFIPQTNIINGGSTTAGPVSVNIDAPPYEQYSLSINGQTTAQSGAQSRNQPLNPQNSSGGLQHESQQISSTNSWESNGISTLASQVGDPRFESYYNSVWGNTHDVNTAYTAGSSYWKGVDAIGGSKEWINIFPPPLQTGSSTWVNRDNIARAPSAVGTQPTDGQVTPDKLASVYNQSTDSNAAPEVIRNGPMVSIGELGHVFDPANANDVLTAVIPRTDGGAFGNAYSNGGGRSLRIGRPEATGAAASGGAPTAASWDVNGERALNLLDLFTVNNPNMTAGSTNSIATNMISGGALGRINPNTASTNVLAAVFSGIQITSDPGMSGGNRTLTDPGYMAQQVVNNRPYSSFSDLSKVMPAFDTSTNYFPNFATNSSGYLNVYNRVHQEAFGKWVQHLTVQSRSYRIYVIGQVLDGSQNPHASVAMEVGVYLQYNAAEAKYNPVIQYVHVLQ